MCGLLLGLVGPASLAACSTETSTPPPAGNSGGTTETGSGGTAGVTLSKLTDVPVGGGKLVNGPSGKILLVRPTAKEVRGLDPVCPHAGVTVAVPKGGTITCPGHGSTFDAATGNLKGGPATSGLTVIPVKINGDVIVTA
jgi:nitrite reductase/ring-hydroxylating ferredoxin subunit